MTCEILRAWPGPEDGGASNGGTQKGMVFVRGNPSING